MIEVRDITKVYGRGRKRVIALSHVSFTLQDRGMVFIVGKSGCGKSTLLNMIGGCDKLTAGDIVMDGNKFSDFHEHDYDNFRNDYVGFVFQDYCLLEGITVEQNVALALDLKGERNDKAVKEALEKVGLSECAARRPSELSGGQKQRVAIARTLVKNPKLILADEPTGNLDEKSTHIILDILKELSETTLVVIVSHNRLDAETYADRILELSDGRIIGDISRNPDSCELSFRGRDIVMQKGTVFTDMDLARINAKFSWGGVYLKQTDDKFLPTPPIVGSGGKREFASHKLSPRGRKILFAMFAKKRIIGTVVTALTIVFLMIVMGVCQLFTKFAPNAEIQRLLTEEGTAGAFIMQKGYKANEYATSVTTDRMVRTTEGDISAFREKGYGGKAYPLYNVSALTHTATINGALPMWEIESFVVPSDTTNYSKFYCNTGLGTLVTDMGYLNSIYGENGELKLLSGTLETEGDKLLVTDYFADSLLYYNHAYTSLTEDPYAKLTTGKPFFNRYRIGGVIDTGYKERYKELMEAILSGKTKEIDPEAYANLLTELDSTLNITYSFNPDFYEAYVTDPNITRESHYGTLLVSDGEHTYESIGYCSYSGSLKEGQVQISRKLCANLLGIEEQDVDEKDIIGKKLTMTRYERIPQGEPADYTLEVTVAGLIKNESYSGAFYCALSEHKYALRYSVLPYALYFDDVSQVTELYDAGTEMNYVVKSPLATAIYNVSRAAVVFTDMFEFIVGLLLLIIVATLIAFGVGSVRKNMYEIAVVRALGGKARDLALLFFLQMLLVGLAVSLLSVLGLALGANVCNTLLGEGFVVFAKNSLMRRLNFITFQWGTALLDVGIVLALSIIAAVVPFLIMRRAKPREIIRAKE